MAVQLIVIGRSEALSSHSLQILCADDQIAFYQFLLLAEPEVSMFVVRPLLQILSEGHKHDE